MYDKILPTNQPTNQPTKAKAYLSAGLLAAGLVLGNPAQATLLYDITELGTFGGDLSYGVGINASGQVTGNASTANGERHAFITGPNGQGMTDLGMFIGGNMSSASDINDSGQVMGIASTANGDSHAFVTNTSGQMTDLGTLGGDSSYGASINNSGQVVGDAQTTTGSYTTHAFITSPNGQMTDLGTLGGNNSYGKGINDSGQVTGYSSFADNNNVHAFITSPGGQMTALLPDAVASKGLGINAFGQVTGWFAAGNEEYHLFITSAGGQMTDLGILTGNFDTTTYGINASGQVVGGGFVTDNGVMNDLNTLLVASATGWDIKRAYDINDAGQIAGWGIHNGLTRAFLLTPVAVPVPAAIWMMGSGLLGLVGVNVRRRASV